MPIICYPVRSGGLGTDVVNFYYNSMCAVRITVDPLTNKATTALYTKPAFQDGFTKRPLTQEEISKIPLHSLTHFNVYPDSPISVQLAFAHTPFDLSDRLRDREFVYLVRLKAEEQLTVLQAAVRRRVVCGVLGRK